MQHGCSFSLGWSIEHFRKKTMTEAGIHMALKSTFVL